MHQKILNHYLQFGTYTYPGLYQDKLKNDLPDDLRELGLLIRKNIIHRSTLEEGNTGTNADLRFGDMTQVPWWRQAEDDVLPTAGAMLTELYRRDSRGLVNDRAVENKLVVTCRYVSILTAAILKSKNIPCRVRSGHAAYFDMSYLGNVSTDHWLNEYWDAQEQRWVLIDVDGSISLNDDFDPYDMPREKFDFPADSWLNIRAKKIVPEYFHNGCGTNGTVVVLWALFDDFNSLMNNEILYAYGPACGYGNPSKFAKLTEKELARVDHLAKLMQDPDANFAALTKIWETEKDFRRLSGGLL